LYKKFLGTVCNNIIVEEAKLNLEERTALENNISLEEFDQSINNAKLKSAPGADGISNRFIKKFWGIFRVPCSDWQISATQITN
jgi:hypothetical protein